MSIEPIDVDRCQTEIKEGSFMTLGPRFPKQCTQAPKVLVVERKPAPDGSTGAMSLCAGCYAKFVEIVGTEHVYAFKIKGR